MVTVFVHSGGETRRVESVDPAWLQTDSGVYLWMDIAAPTAEDGRVLSEVFHFHELAVEDALSEVHHPKVEAYDGYLYLIVHGVDFETARHRFATHDVDFFIGSNYVVSVHDGTVRSIARLIETCARSPHVLGEGPVAVVHRTIDSMVDNYLPEVERLEEVLERLEKETFEAPSSNLIKAILELKHDVASLRQVTLPQRDVVGRLARREFSQVSESLAYRFRDVYDHLVRLSDDAIMFQDRITSLLEAHLSNVSNRLNEVMKVLTVIATIFMPLTVLTSVYGMNVRLPQFPGGEAVQFWWIFAIMLGVSGVMLWLFAKRKWL